MIDAKLKGEGVDLSEPAEPDRTNVVDLMSALKKSLGEAAPEKAEPVKKASESHELEASGSGQTQARLSGCLFFPTFDAYFPSLLLQAHGSGPRSQSSSARPRNRQNRTRDTGNGSWPWQILKRGVACLTMATRVGEAFTMVGHHPPHFPPGTEKCG
jgi:hypothetical protein